METSYINFESLSVEHIKQLNEINEEIKKDFIKLVNILYKKSDGSIYWLVNSLLSRNNYISDVFSSLCYLELVKRIISKSNVKGVTVKSTSQRKVLKKYFQENNFDISIKCSDSNINSTKEILLSIYFFLQNIYTSLIFLNAKKRKRRDSIPNDHVLTLIDTFFVESMFKGNKYNDRYYNGLIDCLSDDEKKRIFFLPTILFRKKINYIIKICDKVEEQFLFKFDYLKLQDYIFALLSPIRINKINLQSLIFRDFKIGPILKSDFYKNISNQSSFEGILNYRLFLRLKENKVKLRFVVNWFENQVIDRGFNKGKNVFYPSVPSVGYQGFVAPCLFHTIPTSIEQFFKVLPDKIAVPGNKLVDILKEYSFQINVFSAPAFRFSNLYNSYNKKTSNLHRKIIFITLPILFNESSNIISLVTEVIRLKLITNARWLVKPHPGLNFRRLNESLPFWPQELKIVNDPFSNVINQSDILLTGSSSTCLESIAFGVPSIVVGNRHGITQNFIPQIIEKSIWDICYTVDEFYSAYKRLCVYNSDQKKKQYIQISKGIKRDYFMSVTNEAVLKFLDIENVNSINQ